MNPASGEPPGPATPPGDATGPPTADGETGRSPRAGRRRRPGTLAALLAEVGEVIAPTAGAHPAPQPAPPPPPAQVVLPAGAVRRLRRRRSATALPPLPRATDVPDDAAGRVDFITVETVVTGAALTEASTDQEAPPAAAEPAAPAAARLTGWLPLMVLGVAIVAVFVLGMLATR